MEPLSDEDTTLVDSKDTKDIFSKDNLNNKDEANINSSISQELKPVNQELILELKKPETKAKEFLVGLYVRVSTREQAEQGLSIENQIKRGIDYMKMKQWNKYKIYADEGVSASTKDRPKLQELFKDIKDKKINTVLVLRINRISRSVLNFLDMMEIFRKDNIEFISITENLDSTSSLGRFVIILLAGLAQLEREQIVERTTEVQDEIMWKRDGRVNYFLPRCAYIPVRTILNGKLRTTSWTIDEKGRRSIQAIFRWYYKGYSIVEISRMLKSSEKDYCHIGTNTIYTYLKNPVFTGYLRRKGELKSRPELKIVRKEIWISVQKVLESNGYKSSKNKMAVLERNKKVFQIS